ncbi:MAG: hypothetical protein GX181_05505 [Synergistaceae bacterium]|nr:hypothetical protein [Synergistota bacterium]NLM71397.1 hypothetical protein [Synergistaceae bacterium]
MSKASQIVILCEDKAHEIFAKRFLTRGWGVKHRAIRVPSYPSGKGSGKRFVTDNFAKEAAALRKRSASTILIVMHDADELPVERARSSLESRLHPSRRCDEPIVFIIPKWHIETWIAWLHDEIVNENDKHSYKAEFGRISESKEAHVFIDALSDDCRNNRQLKNPPESLVLACQEFERIRNRLASRK